VEHQAASSDTTEVARSKASIASGVALAAAAWVVARAVVSISYGAARNPFKFRVLTWARWDSVNYMLIAERGITFYRCAPNSPVAHASATPLKWCGTAGWLPGYPWMIRAVHALGMNWNSAALWISWLATLCALFLVWYGWCRDIPQGRAFLLLLLFGVFPGAVYNFAVFPTSLALVFVLGALIAVIREHFLLGALLIAAAGLCYPSAWFAAFGLAVALVAIAYSSKRSEVARRAVYGALGLSSLLVLVIISRPWNAYFLLDHQPGLNAKGFPGEDFLRLVFTQNTIEQRFLDYRSASALAVQGVLAFLFVGAAVAIVAKDWRRHLPDAATFYPAAASLGVLLGVLALNANGGAWNRSIVLAAPSIVCLRKLSVPMLSGVVVAAGITTALVSSAFFTGTLV
jgi:hypothetical protein